MKLFKLVVSALLQLVVATAVVLAFLGVPYCALVCKTQPALTWVFLAIVLSTFVFGRWFCRMFCPLGALQDIVNLVFHPKTKVRRVCSRLPRGKLQLVVNWIFVLVAILPAVGAVLNPYGVFGRAVAFVVDSDRLLSPLPYIALALGVFVLAVVSAAIGRGRFWCNWICPYGTVFHLLSKCAFMKDKVGGSCGNCRKCFAKSEMKEPEAEDGVTRRETLQGIVALAVAEKLTDGGYAPISLAGIPKRETRIIMPPGTKDSVNTYSCIGCQLCAINCPGECLRPIDWSGRVAMDYRKGYCIEDCAKCTEVCPAGVLTPLTVLEKRNVHIGRATWNAEACLRKTNGEQCTACVRKCPVKALHIVEGLIVVDADACIGCGACEHVCAARPEPAIHVEGLHRQLRVTPISEEDLVAEMKRLVNEEDESIVVARDGIIRAHGKGKGIAPAIKLLDAGKLHRAFVCDRVIGRASAAILIAGGAKKVWTRVLGEDAKKFLEDRGVECAAEKTVKKILNADLSDRCPMEKAVDNMNDPKKMVEKLRKELKERNWL